MSRSPSFAALLHDGRPLITTELVPPRGADGDGVRAQVRALGFADAVNVTDLPQAHTRMSALAAAAIVVAGGQRAILQMTCRDRNRLALAADAIGAAALGVEAILPLWGDHVPDGVASSEVRDLDSAGLIALIGELNAGHTPDGHALAPPTALAVGSAASPGYTRLDALQAKVDAGATFVQTQIVLDARAFAEWLEPVVAAGLAECAAILAGVAIPSSGRMVERMHTLGALVAPGVAERAERGEGAAVARELVETLLGLPGVAGLHLMPLGAPADAIGELAAHARAVAPAPA